MHSHMHTDRETRFEHTPQPPSWLIATPPKKGNWGNLHTGGLCEKIVMENPLQKI